MTPVGFAERSTLGGRETTSFRVAGVSAGRACRCDPWSVFPTSSVGVKSSRGKGRGGLVRSDGCVVPCVLLPYGRHLYGYEEFNLTTGGKKCSAA